MEDGVEEQMGVLPTRKWIATQVTAVAAFTIAWVTAAEWNSTLSIALIGLISQAVISYLVPNAHTSGAVPAVTAAAPAAAAMADPRHLPTTADAGSNQLGA
jgi:hypothetical protein